MEILIYILLLFVVLNCISKLSMWRWWQRTIYSVVLGLFAWLSVDWASQQSKTQLSDFLHNTSALQNMAVVITIETVVCVAYCFAYFVRRGSNDRNALSSTKRSRLAMLLSRGGWFLLKAYPSLLMFPVVFYLLTQLLFSLTGVNFSTIALLMALSIALLLPLLAEGFRWLLPSNDDRVELHLLLSMMVCVLGLLSTQTGQIIYSTQQNAFDGRLLLAVVVLFVVLATMGFVLYRFRWRHHKSL